MIKTPATATKKERSTVPSHVFLDPATARYPVKRNRKGKWVYSCKDLTDARTLANLHGDTAIARKATALLEAHCP